MSFGPLVSVDWLKEHIGDPDVRVIDFRWYLLDRKGRQAGGWSGTPRPCHDWLRLPGSFVRGPHAPPPGGPACDRLRWLCGRCGTTRPYPPPGRAPCLPRDVGAAAWGRKMLSAGNIRGARIGEARSYRRSALHGGRSAFAPARSARTFNLSGSATSCRPCHGAWAESRRHGGTGFRPSLETNPLTLPFRRSRRLV